MLYTGLKFLFTTFTHFIFVLISYEYIIRYVKGGYSGAGAVGIKFIPFIIWFVLLVELIISLVCIWKGIKSRDVNETK